MHSRTVSALGLIALATTGAAHAQQTVYAIGNGGSSLVRFMSDDPGNVTVVGDFSGDAVFLDAIDFRPLNGQLYGYLDSADAFYTVDLNTAALTLASTSPAGAPSNTFEVGLDFNPTIDRARLISTSAQNIVYNPNDGSTTAFTNLFYGAGDPNEGVGALIIDNAYTQNFAGSTATQQYAIDYDLDILVTLANNAGTLATVGALGVDTDIFTGFDIFTTDAGVDLAYAILNDPSGQHSFYTVDLDTGAATLVGDLGLTNQIYSLAVIPAPTGAALLGLGGVVAIRRRRR